MYNIYVHMEVRHLQGRVNAGMKIIICENMQQFMFIMMLGPFIRTYNDMIINR